MIRPRSSRRCRSGGRAMLKPGMCARFPAGGPAHQFINRTDREVVYPEIGDRSAGDDVGYPSDDIEAVLGSDAKWTFSHKDGTPY